MIAVASPGLIIPRRPRLALPPSWAKRFRLLMDGQFAPGQRLQFEGGDLAPNAIKRQILLVGVAVENNPATTTLDSITPHADTQEGDLGVLFEMRNNGTDQTVPSGWTSVANYRALVSGANRAVSIMAHRFTSSTYNAPRTPRHSCSIGEANRIWLLTFRYIGGFSNFSVGSGSALVTSSLSSAPTVTVSSVASPALVVGCAMSNGADPTTFTNNQSWTDESNPKVKYKLYQPGVTTVNNALSITTTNVLYRASGYIKLTV